MYGEPEAWHRLCERVRDRHRLTTSSRRWKRARRRFRSSIPGLARSRPADYREFAGATHRAHPRRRVAATGAPVLHFGTGTATLLEAMTAAGGDVIGVDWRVPLDEGWERIGTGSRRAGQPRSDPAARTGRADAGRRGRRAAARRRDGPATSSIWATASCRRRRSSMCRRSPASSIRVAPATDATDAPCPIRHRRRRDQRPGGSLRTAPAGRAVSSCSNRADRAWAA